MKTKIIFGNVNLDGAIHSGSKAADGTHDFAVNPVANGRFLINYEGDHSFDSTPAVSVTLNYPDWDMFNRNGSSTLRNAVIVASSPNKLLIKTGNESGDGEHQNFSFMAIGYVV